MKKIMKFVLCLALAMPAMFTLASAASAQDGITVVLDGSPLSFDQEPVIVEGRTLVPLRGIFEAMGASVEWNDETRCVTAVKDDITVSLTIGDNVIYKNGEAIALDVPAQIVNSRTMVPARAVSESFGARVGWNSQKQYVVISTDPILNKALAKTDNVDEFVASFDIKMNVSGFPVTSSMKIGMDFNNVKAFVQTDVDMVFAKSTVINVNGDGKTYIDENGTVSVVEAGNMAVRDETFYDEDVFVFDSETDTHKIYILSMDEDGSEIGVKVIIDKNSCELYKLVIPAEVAKMLDSTIDADLEISVVFDTGEVMQMWNKYNK